MKTIQSYIKEGLKITSKTKVSKSDEDIKTFKEFVDWYQNQIEMVDDNTFSVHQGKELYDKLLRFFKLDLNNRSNFNDFISKTEQYTVNTKYKLYIYELMDARNVKISCLDMSTHKEVSSLTIYSIKIENVKVRLRNESKDKKQEEILMNAFKHILFNK